MTALTIQLLEEQGISSEVMAVGDLPSRKCQIDQAFPDLFRYPGVS
jgi:hypothetical protein